MFLIKELPEYERPRERLLSKGVEALSNTELLALLLRSGSKNESVIELSKRVLQHIDEIQKLKKITVHELMKLSGIKIAKATTIIAAIELGKRLENVTSNNIQILSANDVYHLMKETNILDQEHFYCLFLDTKMFLIKKVLIYIGTVDQITIHPREIFRQAVSYNSSYIIVVHNHPTGDSKASNADISATKMLEEAGQILNIQIADHVIIGKNEYYSYKERRVFKV